ncbi:MAG: ABC transporter ATP-binding protein [Lachnospiraceae bacterium]|nr:ABC transporter ATP-binding protein [Lachnospiraceae bacterium]
MEAIKIKKLTKRYGKFRGIDKLDLTVNKGEFFGFIGPNGAGKSTTIRTLLGLISPTSGGAEILGMDIVKNKEKILAKTGYLPSEAIFYPEMRVKELLKFSADLRRKNCKKETARLCERLQLDTSRKISELSFGNRKKVGIVCALQHDPEIIILDEPTSGLDPLMQKEFFSILREKNQAGATIFMSSHILSEIQNNCTRAAIIREGRIIACDTVEALSRSSARRVVLRGAANLWELPGVRDIQVIEPFADDKNGLPNENTVSFLYSGDMKELLKILTEGEVQDLSITEPDLEEIFMHYYEEDQKEDIGYDSIHPLSRRRSEGGYRL